MLQKGESGGRPFYKSDTDYMYYHSDFHVWSIGDTLGSVKGHMFAPGRDALTPLAIAATWSGRNGSDSFANWEDDKGITLTCNGAWHVLGARHAPRVLHSSAIHRIVRRMLVARSHGFNGTGAQDGDLSSAGRIV